VRVIEEPVVAVGIRLLRVVSVEAGLMVRVATGDGIA
jgi:hypothetical protein